MNFYTLREAAQAIAAQLHPHDTDGRLASAERYQHLIYDNLCAGELIGRYEQDRDPINRNRLGAIIAFHGCVISERDLNDWLDRFGNGVQVSGAAPVTEDAPAGSVADNGCKTAIPASGKPTTAELAATLGPFLMGGRDSESLKTMLGDVRNRRRLAKYREMTLAGKREIALWDVGGVVLYLIEEKYMALTSAREALKKHYPNHLHAIDHISMPEIFI